MIVLLFVALLPGPGSYNPDIDKIKKFERPQKAILAPRHQVTQVRPVIDAYTFDIIVGRDKRPNDGKLAYPIPAISRYIRDVLYSFVCTGKSLLLCHRKL